MDAFIAKYGTGEYRLYPDGVRRCLVFKDGRYCLKREDDPDLIVPIANAPPVQPRSDSTLRSEPRGEERPRHNASKQGQKVDNADTSQMGSQPSRLPILRTGDNRASQVSVLQPSYEGTYVNLDTSQPSKAYEIEEEVPSPMSDNFTQWATDGGEPSRTVYVSNLPESTSDDDLIELFTPIGKVERAAIQNQLSGRPKGCGVVQFATQADSGTAISKFAGYVYHGHRLHVSYVSYLDSTILDALHGLTAGYATKQISDEIASLRQRRTEDVTISKTEGEWSSIWQRLEHIDIAEFSGPESIFRTWGEAPTLTDPWLVASWELPALPIKKEIRHIIVISGSTCSYEASTAMAYLSKHYDVTGIQILGGVERALDDLGKVIVCEDFPLGTHKVQLCAYHSRLILKFGNGVSYNTWMNAKQAVKWICQALRPCPDGDRGLLISKSTMHCGPFVTTYALEPLSAMEHGDNVANNSGQDAVLRHADERLPICWMSLFRSAIVAEDHSVLDFHRWGKGLEVDFGTMVQMAGVENHVWVEGSSEPSKSSFEGGYVLFGFFSALIPVAYERNKGIQWHLVYTDDKPLSLANVLAKMGPRVPIRDMEEIKNNTCFVGWCERAEILLGTIHLRNTVSWSGRPKRSTSLRPSGWTATAQLGLNIGPIQAIGQVSRGYQFINVRQRFEPNDTYAKAIQVASRQVALVFDESAKRAWLIPKLSLMLHLCHTYVRYFANQSPDPVPFAQPSIDGASAALRALLGQGDIVILAHGAGVQDTIRLRNVLVDISANMSNSLAVDIKPRFLRALAPELMDLIAEPGAGGLLSEVSRESFPSRSSSSIAQLVDSVYVCSDLGAAIRPADVPINSTCGCMTLESGMGYLAAHLGCLEELLQRHNLSLQNLDHLPLELGNGDNWSPQSLHPCPHQDTTSFWREHRRYMQKISREKKKLVTTTNTLVITGAIVFGGTDSLWDRILDLVK